MTGHWREGNDLKIGVRDSSEIGYLILCGKNTLTWDSHKPREEVIFVPLWVNIGGLTE